MARTANRVTSHDFCEVIDSERGVPDPDSLEPTDPDSQLIRILSATFGVTRLLAGMFSSTRNVDPQLTEPSPD